MDALGRRTALVAVVAFVVAVGGVLAGGAASGAVDAAGGDEDVPRRLPALAWDVDVGCAPGTSCAIAVADGAVFVHERGDLDDPAARYRLTRVDLGTGALRWSRTVGRSARLIALDDLVVVADKSRFEVYDPPTGELRFRGGGRLAEINRYGTLLLADGDSVAALDPVDGAELWRRRGDLGAHCRDIVVVVAARSEPSAGPFDVVGHRSGEVWWTSEEPFDPAVDSMTCGYGPFVYTTDGDRLHEWDAFTGWLNWTTPVTEPGAIELYREVALVRSGRAPATIVAVERETGDLLWERPAAEVGTLVSIVGRVREDATGVFTLHPMSGSIVNHTDLPVQSPFEIVGASETRVLVSAGSVVTSYGMNDLGRAWELDLGAPPDGSAVAGGVLVVLVDGSLRGYR